MNDDHFVSVAAIAPFWRYAVGPESGRSPAIPFYSLKSATAFYEEAKRELPFSGCCMYKRRGLNGIKTIRRYIPPHYEEGWLGDEN